MLTADFVEQLEHPRYEKILLALVRGQLVNIGGRTYRYVRRGQPLCTHRSATGLTRMDQALQSGVYVKIPSQASDPDDDLPGHRWLWFASLGMDLELLVLEQMTEAEWQTGPGMIGIGENKV